MREKGAVINYSWIRERAKSIFSTTYQNSSSNKEPSFSNCWIRKFMLRHDLTMRKKSTSRIPAEQDNLIINEFVQKIKFIVQKYDIAKENIHNMDETAIFLDMADSQTVDLKGAKRVFIKCHLGAKKYSRQQ